MTGNLKISRPILHRVSKFTLLKTKTPSNEGVLLCGAANQRSFMSMTSKLLLSTLTVELNCVSIVKLPKSE
jgi:hypothetical protein